MVFVTAKILFCCACMGQSPANICLSLVVIFSLYSDIFIGFQSEYISVFQVILNFFYNIVKNIVLKQISFLSYKVKLKWNSFMPVSISKANV